jgi:MFS family permease
MDARLSLTPAKYLLAARALRDFGDGFVAILLPVYLLALGFTPLAVGVIATASLLGSALLTIGVGLLGARYDTRQLLLAAASLMVATGVLFALVHDYGLLLVVAFAGTINPSSGSVSVFVPLEHAALTRAATAASRTHLFARYSLVGALAASVGSLAAALPEFAVVYGLDQITAIKAMFVVYALLGAAGGALYSRVPRRERPKESGEVAALGPSRRIVYKLAALFSLDAFAGGFVVQSLLALWLFERFDLSLASASVFFFWAGLLSAFSFPVAAWLSRRIGLINTMVFTHIPSSIALMLAAVAPSLPIALALLLVRSALSQMDVPTRSSYVMAVVTEAERTAAASFTAVPRSLAAAASPALAGALFAASYRAWPLLICGVLKILYDLLLLAQFRHVKPPEES